MIPTSIDGTDITGATIDGTDVQEITVDGDVVFTSSQTPVAKSDLIAWYPFESSISDSANDSTFGDSTAYDLTEEGESSVQTNIQSSGGVTDVIDGASSQYYDMIPDGNITASLTDLTTPFTAMGWANFDSLNNSVVFVGDWGGTSRDWYIFIDDNEIRQFDDIGTNNDTFANFGTNGWSHVAAVYDSTNVLYLDGSQIGTSTGTSGQTYSGGDGLDIGSRNNVGQFMDGGIDDVRIYDSALTSSQISQIVSNTQP